MRSLVGQKTPHNVYKFYTLDVLVAHVKLLGTETPNTTGLHSKKICQHIYYAQRQESSKVAEFSGQLSH